MHLDEALIRLLLLRLEQPGDTPMYVNYASKLDDVTEPVDTLMTEEPEGGGQARVLVCSQEDPVPDLPDVLIADPAFVIKGNLFAAELLAKIYTGTGHGRQCSYRNKGECDCLRTEMATALAEAGFGIYV